MIKRPPEDLTLRSTGAGTEGGGSGTTGTSLRTATTVTTATTTPSPSTTPTRPTTTPTLRTEVCRYVDISRYIYPIYSGVPYTGTIGTITGATSAAGTTTGTVVTTAAPLPVRTEEEKQ